MNKNKVLKYAAALLLFVGVAYFWQRLEAESAVENHASAHESEPVATPTGVDLNELDKVTLTKEMPSELKEYVGFTVDFNDENKTPNYVAWILHGHETTGDNSRSNKFWTDTELRGCPDTKDYTHSGYDRGHMCPAADQKWSAEAMYDCFVMANMCPQKHELNSGAWKTLEDKERQWANRDSAIVIVAGPIYDSSATETIGENKVRVPSAFFKVMLAPYAQPMRAIGFVYPNMRCEGNMENYAASIDDVEKITGLDFFAALPDDVENEVESTFSFKEWNSNKRN